MHVSCNVLSDTASLPADCMSNMLGTLRENLITVCTTGQTDHGRASSVPAGEPMRIIEFVPIDRGSTIEGKWESGLVEEEHVNYEADVSQCFPTPVTPSAMQKGSPCFRIGNLRRYWRNEIC